MWKSCSEFDCWRFITIHLRNEQEDTDMILKKMGIRDPENHLRTVTECYFSSRKFCKERRMQLIENARNLLANNPVQAENNEAVAAIDGFCCCTRWSRCCRSWCRWCEGKKSMLWHKSVGIRSMYRRDPWREEIVSHAGEGYHGILLEQRSYSRN